jgi:hypothetical protein
MKEKEESKVDALCHTLTLKLNNYFPSLELLVASLVNFVIFIQCQMTLSIFIV